jgi:hypothetical protein
MDIENKEPEKVDTKESEKDKAIALSIRLCEILKNEAILPSIDLKLKSYQIAIIAEVMQKHVAAIEKVINDDMSGKDLSELKSHLELNRRTSLIMNHYFLESISPREGDIRH